MAMCPSLSLLCPPRYDTSVDFSNLDSFEYPGYDQKSLQALELPNVERSLLKTKKIEELRILCKDEGILIGGTKEELVIRMFKEKAKDNVEEHLAEEVVGGQRKSMLEENLLAPGRVEWTP